MKRRLMFIAERLCVPDPDELADQLTLLVNGAFVSSQVLELREALPVLQHAAHALISGNRGSRDE